MGYGLVVTVALLVGASIGCVVTWGLVSKQEVPPMAMEAALMPYNASDPTMPIELLACTGCAGDYNGQSLGCSGDGSCPGCQAQAGQSCGYRCPQAVPRCVGYAFAQHMGNCQR